MLNLTYTVISLHTKSNMVYHHINFFTSGGGGLNNFFYLMFTYNKTIKST